MEQLLVIFDLDGTLVDSEQLCNQALLDLLPSLDETVDELIIRYRGGKLAEILLDLERRHGIRLGDNFERQYRRRVAELFETDLKPVEGVSEMLEKLTQAACIASSGPPEKIRHALAVTGLAEYFGEQFFSSYVVQSWKPDPGLFLHAAAAMGFTPEKCIVVEDSPVGLKAATAARMRSLQYAPRGKRGSHQFCSMNELPAILQDIETDNERSA